MQDIEKLKQRAMNATEKVKKQYDLIRKYEVQLDKLKQKAIMLGCDLNRDSSEYRNDQYWAMCEVAIKERALTEAEKKLGVLKCAEEAVCEELKILENKLAYLEGVCPTVIKEFLESWKNRCYQYYLNHYEEHIQNKENLYKEELEVRKEVLLTHPDFEEIRNKEYVKKAISENEFSTYFLHNIATAGVPRKAMENALKEKKLDYESLQKRITSFAGNVCLQMENFYHEEERNKWLDGFLEREKKEKMMDLIERITSIVGTITDAGDLHIGPKGDINGTIIGDKGMASVETIGAGGYNIQCYHYRTLIHEIAPQIKRRGR